jgi:hypothetical protein
MAMVLAACGGGNTDPDPGSTELPGLWNASIFDLGIGLPETCRIDWVMSIAAENPETGDPFLSTIPQSAIMRCAPEPDRESLLELARLQIIERGDTVVMMFSSPFDTFAVARFTASGLSGEMIETYRGARFAAARRSGSVDPNLALFEISLFSEFADIEVGDSMPFFATGEDGYGRQAQDLTVQWESSEPGAASIRDDGMLHGLIPGETTVTARADEVEATKEVVVLTPAASVEIIEAPDAPTVPNNYVLRAAARDAGGQVLPDRRFHWTSADPAVATVEGLGERASFSAVSPGSVTITARSSTVSASVTLTVAPE